MLQWISFMYLALYDNSTKLYHLELSSMYKTVYGLKVLQYFIYGKNLLN